MCRLCNQALRTVVANTITDMLTAMHSLRILAEGQQQSQEQKAIVKQVGGYLARTGSIEVTCLYGSFFNTICIGGKIPGGSQRLGSLTPACCHNSKFANPRPVAQTECSTS